MPQGTRVAEAAGKLGFAHRESRLIRRRANPIAGESFGTERAGRRTGPLHQPEARCARAADQPQHGGPVFPRNRRPAARNYYQKDQLLGDRLCPADARIQSFLDSYLDESPRRRPGCRRARLHARPFRPCARDVPSARRRQPVVALSAVIPRRAGNSAQSEKRPAHHKGNFPYRRRRTAHSRGQNRRSEAGLSRSLLAAALRPPPDVMALPFTANQEEQVRLFVTLLLRPLVCPATGSDARQDNGDPVLRAGQPGEQPGFRRRDFRQRRRSCIFRKTTPRSM